MQSLYMEEDKNYQELLRRVYKKIPNANMNLIMRCKKNYDENIDNFKNKDWNSIIIQCMERH